MDPKLRPSFEEIRKTLEEIMSRLQEDELERDRKLQPTAKGKRSDQNPKPDPKGRGETVGHSLWGQCLVQKWESSGHGQ